MKIKEAVKLCREALIAEGIEVGPDDDVFGLYSEYIGDVLIQLTQVLPAETVQDAPEGAR